MDLIGFGVDKFENDTFVIIAPMELKHIKNLYRYQCVFNIGESGTIFLLKKF